MDAFSYLSVLISIILGLAITQILLGFRGMMLARSRILGYWPCVVWAVVLLVIDVQAWWAMYELRAYPHWTFIAFAAVLAETVPLYLLAALVLPDVEAGRELDLRTHYYANHRWFFTMGMLLIVASLGKNLVLYGKLPPLLDSGFQLMFLAAFATGALTTDERWHKFLAPLAAVAVGAYIALLFMPLPRPAM
jgi:hypothetical protein